jgi:hypothetical protein
MLRQPFLAGLILGSRNQLPVHLRATCVSGVLGDRLEHRIFNAAPHHAAAEHEIEEAATFPFENKAA